ncbi:MAG: diguanylate cyclase [Planctomycetota bacterium]
MQDAAGRVVLLSKDAGLAASLRSFGLEVTHLSTESAVSAQGLGESDGCAVVLDADHPLGRNAFSECRRLKANPRRPVFIAIAADDAFSAEIARFCMADGVLVGGAADEFVLAKLGARGADVRPRQRPAVDALLSRLEEKLVDDPARVSSGLVRMLEGSAAESVAARFTDAETGLFDAAFAGFKLDEELKRAVRFHQPLALLLLDCGVAAWPVDATERAAVLAEVAGVFLEETRDIDVLARFSPTVFLFLLPGTGLDGASILATRIADSLREREFSASIRLAPAIGLATAPHPEVRDRRSFLARAEGALEQARRQGRQVVVAE